MKRIKKILLILFCLLSSVLCTTLLFTVAPTRVYASNSNYPTLEEYTSSDKLINLDGSSSEKTIQVFSEEVKSAMYGTCFDELDEVIPAQYLNTTEKNAVFQYNGTEYGFYVAKEGDRFDVLLIDFVYEFEDDNHK